MHIVRRVIPAPESDYILDLALGKIVDISQLGNKALTADEIFESLEKDCYSEVPDYDPETKESYIRLVQTADNDIENIERLYSVLEFIRSDDFMTCSDTSVENDKKTYDIRFLKIKKFLNAGGYQGQTYRNIQEERRDQEYHTLTKILAAGVIIPSVYYLIEILRNWYNPLLLPFLYVFPFSSVCILGWLLYRYRKSIQQWLSKYNRYI
jgi:hypothetical protein